MVEADSPESAPESDSLDRSLESAESEYESYDDEIDAGVSAPVGTDDDTVPCGVTVSPSPVTSDTIRSPRSETATVARLWSLDRDAAPGLSGLRQPLLLGLLLGPQPLTRVAALACGCGL